MEQPSSTIADSTGVMTIGSSVLTTTDINGGTIDNTTISTSDITVGSGKTLDVSSGTLTLANDQISGDKVRRGHNCRYHYNYIDFYYWKYYKCKCHYYGFY